MHRGTITQYTTPSNIENDYVLQSSSSLPFLTRRASFNAHFLSSDTTQVTLAVEIHHVWSHILLSDPFFAVLFLLPTGSFPSPLSSSEADNSHVFSSLLLSTDYIPISPSLPLSNDADTRTTISIASSLWIQATYATSFSPLFLVNTYSIAIANAAAVSLVAWRLEGSRDEQRWTVLDAKEGSSFFLHHSTFSADLPAQTTLFSFYRIVFLSFSSSSPLTLADFSLALKPLSPPRVELAYSLFSLTLFPSQSDVYIAPTLNGFSSFSITPTTLPQGLSFSTLAGSFYGTLAPTASSASFSITATFADGATHRTTVTLFVLPCVVNQAFLSIETISAKQASAAFWTLANDRSTLATGRGENTAVPSSFTQTFCLPFDMYTLTLDSTTHTPWPRGTLLRLTLTTASTTLTIGSVTHTTATSIAVSLPLRLLSDGTAVDWTYHPSSSVPADWTQDRPASVWEPLPDSLTLAQSVWLFRKQVSLPSIASEELVEFRVFCRAGLLLVSNGVEFHRHSIPAGEITSSTVAQDPTPIAYWHVLSFTAAEASLRSGTNVLAIAVVNPDAQTRAVDFRAVIHLSGYSAFVAQQFTDASSADSLSLVDSAHIGDHAAGRLVDADLSSFFSSSGSAFVTLLFHNQRSDKYNTYCLTSAPTHASTYPVAWTLSASNDGSAWVSLDAVSAASFSLGESKCSFFPSGAFSHYRLHLERSQSSLLNLAEFGLFFVKAVGEMEPLSLSPDSLQGFLGCPITSYALSSSHYRHFSVQPALPAGLSLDAVTGLLFGTPSELHEASQFSLTAESHGGSPTTAVFSLAILQCDEETSSFSLFRVAVSDFAATNENHIEFWILSTAGVAAHAVVVGEQPWEHREGVTSFERSFCVPCGAYTVRFEHVLRGAITPSYSLSLSGADEVYSGTFDASTTASEFRFDTTRLIHPITTSWHYRIDSSEPPANWFQSATSALWPEATPASLPHLSTLTSYYCTTFQAAYTSSVSAFSVGVRSRGGIVVYLNGMEISRARMPAGPVTHFTPPTSETPDPEFIVFSGSVQFLPFVVDASAQVEGGREGDNNRLCVELHRKSAVSEVNFFAASLKYVASGSDRVLDGESWGSVQGIGAPWHEYVANAFDKNIRSKYFGSSTCEEVAARWTYASERREFANRLRFYAGNSFTRRPRRLRLEGSQNGESWKVLLESEELTWESGGYGEWKEWRLSNQESFHAYQLVGNGCGSEGIEFAEVLLFADRVNVACAAVDGFPAANEGEESHGPCPEFMTGYAIRICQNGHFSSIDESHCIPTAPTSFSYEPQRITAFTYSFVSASPVLSFYVSSFSIKPSLPAGLVLSFKTGRISGTPVEASFVTTYTITAKNSRGSSRAFLEIIVKSGCPSIGDFPSTPVGEEAEYRCSKNYWMYGKVRRLCTEHEGMAVWGEPRGYCKSSVMLVVVVVLAALILCAVVITWCVNESMNRRMNVYQLPNGEYEMEEVGEKENMEAGEKEETERVRVRPAMKLVGRPVFLYIPRYFHKKKKDYSYEYKRLRPRELNRIWCVCWNKEGLRVVCEGSDVNDC